MIGRTRAVDSGCNNTCRQGSKDPRWILHLRWILHTPRAIMPGGGWGYGLGPVSPKPYRYNRYHRPQKTLHSGGHARPELQRFLEFVFFCSARRSRLSLRVEPPLTSIKVIVLVLMEALFFP
jgi:hypothetical protein